MSELTRRYAKALYEVFPDEAALKNATGALCTAEPLWAALISPAISTQEKWRVLSRLPEAAKRPVLASFFGLLAKKGRLSLLPEILREFHVLDLTAKNAAECVMTCVHAPNDAQQAQICAVLCRLHRKAKVRLIIRTDAELLGGFILNIEGVTYDRSVRGALSALSRHLEEVNTP